MQSLVIPLAGITQGVIDEVQAFRLEQCGVAYDDSDQLMLARTQALHNASSHSLG